MKHCLFAIVIGAAAFASAAQAQDTLEPITVERANGYRIVEHCTPPNSAPECAAFHELIRQSFSEREIGMLFGAATPYPEYRTTYDAVRERYDNLVQYVEDNGMPVVANATIYAPRGRVERRYVEPPYDE